MGMSTSVVGFRPPDEKWKQMKAAWDACRAAGIESPKEVAEFFNYMDPDEAGVEVRLTPRYGEKTYAPPIVQEWNDDKRHASGFEIDLERLRESHPQLTKIRFYNSW